MEAVRTHFHILNWDFIIVILLSLLSFFLIDFNLCLFLTLLFLQDNNAFSDYLKTTSQVLRAEGIPLKKTPRFVRGEGSYDKR